jgi:hypothetical protein
MEVKCISNTGEFVKTYETLGYFASSQFALKIGKTYLVMGIVLSEGLITFLVDESGIPLFYPFQLFKIVKPEIEVNWKCKIYTKESDYYPFRQGIWGFSELCDDKFLDSLLEREKEALAIYFQTKKGYLSNLPGS